MVRKCNRIVNTTRVSIWEKLYIIYLYLQDESKAVCPADVQASDSNSLSADKFDGKKDAEERRSVSSGGNTSLLSESIDTSAAAATIASSSATSQGTGGEGNTDRGGNDRDETDKEVS